MIENVIAIAPTHGQIFRDTLKSGNQGTEMVIICPGKFQMGGTNSVEQPIHEVNIAYYFAIGKYQVTFDEYYQFCQATKRHKPDDAGWGQGRHPIINVGWKDAVAYCCWLSEQTGKIYRLPSEAEWEFACRAGSNQTYCFSHGNALSDYAWYDYNSREKTHPVGEKRPNDWGLYDVHGNVYEWCLDCWHHDYQGAPNDGSAWDDGSSEYHPLRGGSWHTPKERCTAAFRTYNPSGYIYYGFRVLCVIAADQVIPKDSPLSTASDVETPIQDDHESLDDQYAIDSFWVQRCVNNIANLSPFEEGALIGSAAFREAVKMAFFEKYGSGSELYIETDGKNHLSVSWNIPK